MREVLSHIISLSYVHRNVRVLEIVNLNVAPAAMDRDAHN